MSGDDALLSGLASGDAAGAAGASMKREHDSTDDFEHLVGEREAAAPRAATQSFLDMERELMTDVSAPAARAPSPHAALAPPPADQLADKFTDSESDADTAGESPLHRPAPAPPAPAPAPPAPAPAPPASDPTPVLAPTPAPPPPAAAPPAPAPPAAREPEPVPPPKPELARPVQMEPAAAPQPRQPSPPLRPSAPPPAAPAPASAPPAPAAAPVAHVIEAEVIFCQMGLVESLIYWRCPARSGGALGAGLALLVALACCSVVSVAAYGALLALSAAVGFRVYRNVLQAVQKTNEGHPFKWLLEKDLSVPADRAQALAAAGTAHLNAAIGELRRLFLVEDLVDSLKFGVLLWCLTYVGACFNGITLIILGWIALFTVPKAYEMNKAQVDANLELARAKINEITAKVRAAVPLGRKSESDKDK